MNPYILWNTIWGLDEKLASCQTNCLNIHCYKYENLTIAITLWLSIKESRNWKIYQTARPGPLPRKDAVIDTGLREMHKSLLDKHTRQEGPVQPFSSGIPEHKGGFKSCFFEKWKTKVSHQVYLRFLQDQL